MRAFFFALGRAFSSFWRRSFVTFLSIITITIALVILGAFMVVTLNLRSTLGSLRRQVQLELYLQDETTRADAASLIDELKKEEGVEGVEFVTAERARMEFIDEYGEELLRGLPGNPLPPSLRIELSQSLSMDEAMSRIAGEYKKHRLVTELSAPSRLAGKLVGASRLFLILTIGWGIILLFSATLIITNTVRLAIAGRADSIEIMQLVGASRSFVRLPFLMEGLLHGAVSGGLAWLVLYGLQEGTAYLIPSLNRLPLVLNISLVVMGALFGVLGSSIALRRHLKY